MDVYDLECSDARQRLSLRADGELTAPEEGLLDQHLATCVDCRVWAAQLGDLVGQLRTAPVERPVRDLRVPRGSSAYRLLAGVAAVAAVAVTVLSVRVQSPPLLTPELSPQAAKNVMTLKERQLAALATRPVRERPRSVHRVVIAGL
jgi:anti-sigma factor RsiW